jgi:uncharacterized SAM-binding protein YcdF (DUF218 family)
VSRGGLTLTLALVLGAAALGILATSLPLRTLDISQAACRADAILVPGGDPAYERTAAGVALYRAGWAPLLVVSGSGSGGDSGVMMARYARAQGVPAAAIEVEAAAESTHENMAFSARLLRRRGAHRVLLVTSPRHLLRATLAARHEMPEIDIVPISSGGVSPTPRSSALSEYGKLAYYVLRRFI